MNKFNSEKVMPRYFAIAIIFTVIGFAILGKAMYIMTIKKDYWTKVAARLKRDSVCLKPTRGNILSCDGQLMASSIPEYRIYMDFKAGGKDKDSLLGVKMDSICEGLAEIFPEYTAEKFRVQMELARKDSLSHYPIWRKRIDYNTFTQVKSLPVFNLSKYKGGFHWEEFNARRRPFGSLAQRTVGDMFGAKDTARCGLELSFDSILRGTNGLTHRRKVLNKYMNIPVMQPIDGADIVTTIDVNMQDIAERAVIDELKDINGDLGVAILMEVETGDIKAIVNMSKCVLDNGEVVYREIKNNAVADLREPGSVFKTASILVALDDGVIPNDTNYIIHTGCGIVDMHGRPMKDHNWRRGGYQDINVARSLEVSSNIGVSHVIDKFYGHKPEKFIESIYRTGLASDLHIPLVGSTKPRIRKPEKDKYGHWTNWSKTALPWMSIGYETQIPPISTVTFYNAIANNGKMMRPRFVKAVMKNGEVVAEFPPEVVKTRIAKPATIKMMQTILEHVVSQGLGKKAGSKSFKVAGKTGTAQISQGAGGYKSGTVQYWLSFAGYFPADAPRYSCIVCLKKSGLPASGGGMSGLVFHRISEGVMAQSLKLHVKDARDSLSVMIPEVKDGDIIAADYVLHQLGIRTNVNQDFSYANGNPIWGKATLSKEKVMLTSSKTSHNVVPDVTGMGARDAVYLMECRGIQVKLHGRGKVKSQSIPAGNIAKKESVCELRLQ